MGSVHLGEFAPPVAAMTGYAVPYAIRCGALRRAGRPVERWRRMCFGAGVVLVLVAISPPIDNLADRLLVAHMVQHIVLGDLAALLIAVGLTAPLLQPLLRRRPGGPLRWLGHPGPALALWLIDLYGWHAPFAYQAALRNDLLHSLQHACFFLFGLNMWLALVGPLPKPAWFGNLGRLGYVVCVRFAGALLANVLIWSGTIFYPYYTHGEAASGVSALQDQGLAGAVMLLTESVITVGLLAWLFMRAAAEGERRQELIEFAARHGVALAPERAARAVAAGRADALRTRLAGRRQPRNE
jgi:putative membrane protein